MGFSHFPRCIRSQQEGLIFLNYNNFDPFVITFPNYSHEFVSVFISKLVSDVTRESTLASLSTCFQLSIARFEVLYVVAKQLCRIQQKHFLYKCYDHSQDYQNHITHLLHNQMKRHWKTRIYVDLAAKRGGSLPIALV